MIKTSGNNLLKYTGEAMLLLMTLIWGGTFVIVKESLNDISSMLFLFLRFVIAGSIIAIYLVFKRYRIDKKAILPGVILGSILFLSFVFQTIGLKYTSATKSAFLTGTFIVFVPLLQIVIERKIPTRGATIGTLLVLAGILFLSSSGNSFGNILNEIGGNFNIGDGLTIMCALLFAFQVIYMDIYSPKFDFWSLFITQLITVALLSLILGIFFDFINLEPLTINLTENLWIGILYTSILATCLCFGLQTKFQKTVTPTKASIIYSFEPIFAALFAFFLLSEKISNFGLVGSALIFLGLIISEVFDTFWERINSQRIANGNSEG